MRRVQEEAILRDLEKKMVLLAGPRQAGKTTIAHAIGRHFKRTVYLNYDLLEDRRRIEAMDWLPGSELVILDELHKMANWKGYLKGLYDTKPRNLRLLVTGSARLEIFREVGDSLAGRYYSHRLLPLSPAELAQLGMEMDLDHFLDRGGFPEPFLEESDVDAKRWRKQYVEALLQEDVLDFDNIQNIRNIRLLFELLRQKVGSTLSYTSIAQDLAISPNTVKKYIQILEALYIVFRVTPFSKNIARSILKEPKLYFFDTGLVKGDEGARFENLVACCLLKSIYARNDYKAENCSLYFLRTKEGEEVDFAVVSDEKVEQMIEVKSGKSKISKALLKFHKRYDFPALQVVRGLRSDQVTQGVILSSGRRFLAELYL